MPPWPAGFASVLRLADPVFALDAAVEFEIGFGGLDIGSRPRRDLVEMENAVLVELPLVDRADALDREQVVGPSAARRRQPV